MVKALADRLPARAPARLQLEGVRCAAVAVLLVDRGGAPFVPFTLRAEALRAHSGQVSLPGGGCEKEDADAVATALREAEEEIGVSPSSVRVLGVLDDVVSSSGYAMTPVIGELRGCRPDAYRPDAREVAQVFEAPVAVFADRRRAEWLGTRTYRGMTYELRAYRSEDGHRIWGATARVMEALVGLVVGEGEGA